MTRNTDHLRYRTQEQEDELRDNFYRAVLEEAPIYKAPPIQPWQYPRNMCGLSPKRKKTSDDNRR